MSDDVIFTREKHIGLVTLNRAQALNALTFPMILALQEQLQAWQNDRSIHAVVVRAVEGRAFCAGGDIRSLYDTGRRDKTLQMQFFWHEYRLNHFIHHFNKPYIALMDGVTMGGGVGISLHGSHPVATERFLFAMPETGIGFFPDIGASHLLSRCPGAFGAYLGLTGNRLDAVDSHALGLVQHLITSDKLTEVLDGLVETDLSTNAHERVDVCLSRFAIPASPAPIKALQDSINICFNQDTVESILVALHETDDDWHRDTLQNLAQKAPLSLKVTLAQIRKAKSMSLADCLKIDYCLVSHFVQDHDFYEGVRALIIDKDKSPRWQPKTLAEVTADKVHRYFEHELQQQSLFNGA